MINKPFYLIYIINMQIKGYFSEQNITRDSGSHLEQLTVFMLTEKKPYYQACILLIYEYHHICKILILFWWSFCKNKHFIFIRLVGVLLVPSIVPSTRFNISIKNRTFVEMAVQNILAYGCVSTLASKKVKNLPSHTMTNISLWTHL
jgi:hypothetical protein